MFQSNVEGVQNTELRVCKEDVHIECSLSVHACYKLAVTIYFDVSRSLQFPAFRSWAAVKQGFLGSIYLFLITVFYAGM